MTEQEIRLKAFCYADTDTIVAESIEDAKAALVEMGCYAADYEEDEWVECPSDESLLINFEDAFQDGWPEGASVVKDGGTSRVTATIAAWVEWYGRGLLCSTEW